MLIWDPQPQFPGDFPVPTRKYGGEKIYPYFGKLIR